VFTKPFTYSIYYYRLEHQPGTQPYSAGELTCDPTTNDREHMLSEPQSVPLTMVKAEPKPAKAVSKK
jgi:hypothetical protein